MSASVLSARELVRTYKRGREDFRALDGVSMEIATGEFVALLGPNGSGKSTLMRLMATLDRQGAGELAWFGSRLADAGVRGKLGVAFQSPGLDKLLTIEENLLAAAAVYGLTGERARSAIEQACSVMGISDRLRDRVATLSGGLARRADLARATLHGPELLLLDEPTAGLDLSARNEFLAAIARWRASQRVTIVMSTHFMDEAEHAQRVILMHAGKVVGDGSPASLRATLGGVVVRVGAAEASGEDAAARELMQRAGLGVQRESSTTLIGKAASVDAESLKQLMGDLLSRGLSVAAGPATLGDVYLALTGSSLGEHGEPRREWEAPSRGARR